MPVTFLKFGFKWFPPIHCMLTDLIYLNQNQNSPINKNNVTESNLIGAVNFSTPLTASGYSFLRLKTYPRVSQVSFKHQHCFAESEGFEPPGPEGPTVFKTAALDHSANSPILTGNVRCFQKPKFELLTEILLYVSLCAAERTRTSTGLTPTSPSSWRVYHSATAAYLSCFISSDLSKTLLY